MSDRPSPSPGGGLTPNSYIDPKPNNERTTSFDSDIDRERAESNHVTMASPSPSPERLRPPMIGRKSLRGQSNRSISDAMRLAQSREEQEMLLGDNEEADDDGCFPPRLNDDPRVPNPHASLPVYTTIHRIRRLVIASIGE